MEIIQQKFSLSAPKPPHKKGFETLLKQEKTRKDLHPTKLDFQNSNHLHDLGCNAKGQLTISYMLAKLFTQKVDSNFREMKNKCLILARINISGFKNNWNFFLLRKNIWLFLIFSILWVLVQKKRIYFLLHITSYQYYPLVKTHLYEGYFNMLYYRHMSMCCLIRLHVNMFTLFKDC